jgi:micrococcal nuclease
MKNKKPLLSLLAILANLILLLVITNASQKPGATPVNSDTQIVQVSTTPAVIGEATESEEEALVTRVIDGDTIELQNGKRLRYIGIDSPETGGDCFSREATEKNRELVLNKTVRLIKDVSETDRYGRLLRYVYVKDDVLETEIYVNDALVREGFATAATFPPDIKFQGQFKDAEREARENKRGLWGGCEY